MEWANRRKIFNFRPSDMGNVTGRRESDAA